MARARYADPPDNTVPLLMFFGIAGWLTFRYLTQHPIKLPVITIPIDLSPSNTAAGQAGTPSAPAPGRLPTDPRGIRNNNPGNIVYVSGNNWQGQLGSDGRFAKFDNAINGLRAAFMLLRTYCRNYGLCTIQGIATRWAPAPENNPTLYAKAVQAYAGINMAATLNIDDAATMIKVLRGMIAQENGAAWFNYFSQNDMLQAFNAAKAAG